MGRTSTVRSRARLSVHRADRARLFASRTLHRVALLRTVNHGQACVTVVARAYAQVSTGAYGCPVVIEWRPNAPKWAQVAEVIKQRFADGTYPPDTQLPSQHELVREFEIAPNTAQKVLTRLRQEGTAYSVRGVGTFVSPPREDNEQAGS